MAESGGTRKPRRRRLWLVLGVGAAGLVLALSLLPLLLDIEDFREPIQQAIESATGWEAELGEIDLSIWSGMALTVSPARLAAPGDSSSVEIETIAIRASLLPLLSGRLQVRDVDLLRPRVRLVRASIPGGWVLPIPSAPAEGRAVSGPETPRAPEEHQAESTGFSLSVERIRLRRGSLRVEDRTTDPPLEVELDNVNVVLSPTDGEVSGSGDLSGDRASIAWSGRLDGVPLLSGERLFDDPLEIDFAISTAGERWTLDRVEVVADGVRMTGSGSLLPDIDLGLEIPTAPLAAVLGATEAILPLPLDLEPPGEVRATVRIRQPAGGALTYEAEGGLSAGGFKIDDLLPPARDVRTEFALDREGVLEVRILEGRVGGGPLRGTLRIDPIDPPGLLTFDGELQDAVLGQLLGGLIADAEETISGPTGLDAALGIDLGRETIDARAIAGRLQLSSRQVSLPGWDLEGAIQRRLEEQLGALGQLASLLDGKDRSKPSAAAERLEEVFESVEASIDFDSWPWKLERLSLAGGHLTANGSGSFDPERGQVDVEVSARLDKARTRELVERHSELKVLVDREGRLTLPIEIRGALAAPSVKVDLGRVARGQLGEEPEETLKGLLRGLLDKKRG